MDNGIRLTNTIPPSNKEYTAFLQEKDGGFIVYGMNGRIGSVLQQQMKTQKPVPYAEAKKIFDKLIKEKLAKGYVLDGQADTTSVVTDKVDTNIYPQLLNDIEEEQMEALLQDDRYGMQEKKDGHRRLLEYTKQGVRGINRKGQEVPVLDWFSRQLCALARGLERTLIDNELIGEELWAFDMLWYDGQDIRSEPFINRYNTLFAFLNSVSAPNIHDVPLIVRTKYKRENLAQIKAANGEGVVFKLLIAPYTVGKPASGGTQFKFKFWAEADVIVSLGRQEKGKRSCGMRVYDSQGQSVEIGNVTIPPNYDMPRVGDVAKIRYLYCFPDGGKLYQPQYEGIRTDKTAGECLYSQLKFKAGIEEDSLDLQ